MDDKKLLRVIAMLCFITGASAAFSLGMLSFTFVTGDLPFGLIPLCMKDVKSASSDAGKDSKTESKPEFRAGEDFLVMFVKELEKEKARIAEEKTRLDEQTKNAELIMKQAVAMQSEVEKKENSVGELLKKIDEKEKQNVTDIQKLIVGMEPAAGVNMLLSLDQKLAARILYSMNKKLASQLVSEAMRTKDNREKITKITATIQTLSDELKGDSPK